MSTKKTFRKACSGFSLLELLLVMSLAPIVFFAVYSNFTTGIRLWQRMQLETPEEDAALFRVKARGDFENAMRFLPMPFAGDKDQVQFVTGIEAPETLGGKHAIGQARYYYSDAAHGIFREVRDYSQVYEEEDGPAQRLLARVQGFELSYLVFDPLESKYVWLPAFEGSKESPLPVAVRLRYERENETQAVEQTFFLPAGGKLT